MNRYLLYALAACAVAIAYGWSHINEQAKDLAAAKDRITTLESEAAALNQALTVRDSIDRQYQEVLRNAEDSKTQLVAGLSTGSQRVYVRAACMPTNPGPTGSTHAATPELAADARQDYADLVAANKIVTGQVIELQRYVTEICRKGQ
ncbi:lysis system i-spanin subunit Rz [Pseudomonas lundensis]|uniref:lysis system i-spanin subunit Rz n=1 Tax=Pseudomonas lundensis TaxID=86185 RepID=UPI00069BBA48|nr:lysis system i-spanin subunit Rz [Pseudomonas lundensis]